MNIGQVIKDARKAKGQTQTELAQICGITQTYLSQIENNSKEPNLSTLKTISYNLEIPLPILFFMSLSTEDITPEKRQAFLILNESVRQLIKDVVRI